MLGALERGRGNLEAAGEHFADAVARFSTMPGTNWLSLARCNLGMIRLWQGNLAEARPLLESALAGYLAHDDAFGVAFTKWGLAFVTGDSGRVAAAADILVDVVERSRDAGWNEILIDALFGTGVLAVTARDWSGAAQTLAAAVANAEAIGYAIDAPERSRYDGAAAAAKTALEPGLWENATASGRAFALGDATRAALDLLDSIVVTSSGPANRQVAITPQLEPLSPREAQVIQLIAEGMSDRQIGEELFISHRTVMRHVTNILRRLDVTSRGAAGAWFLRQGRGTGVQAGPPPTP